MLDLLTIKIAILLVACAIATLTDLKDGIIPDKVTFSLIFIGILFNVFESVFIEFNPFNFAPGLIVFFVFFVLYYLGKIGGGDVKLFTGIAFLIPFFQGFPFIVSVLFFSALFAVLFFSIYYSLKYLRIGIDFQENKKGIFNAFLLGIFLTMYFYMLVFFNFMQANAALILMIPLFFALLFIAFQQGIKKNFFLKDVPLHLLEEDEVIAKEFLSNELKEKFEKEKLNFQIKGIITESDKIKLKKLKISSLPVLRGLPPFVPFILLGVILSLLVPDFLSLLFVF